MAALDKPCVVVVCGPTATGKTALALHLARRYAGEVVSADSMQVYRGLVVGTAAVTPKEAGEVPVHLSGMVAPEQRYTVAQWAAAAAQAIASIAQCGRLPVVCGGTGLYIESLVKGIAFAPQQEDPALREALEAQWAQQGGEAMWQRLWQLDEAQAQKLAPADKKRILRALEQSLLTGQTAAARHRASLPQQPPYRVLLLGLNYPEREQLYRAVGARVDAMMENGLLAEAEMVWRHREQYTTAVQAIGYKEFFAWFEGRATLEDCVEALKMATRRYAKRQLTWFRRMQGIHWLDVTQQKLPDAAAALVEAWRAKKADDNGPM